MRRLIGCVAFVLAAFAAAASADPAGEAAI
jgi:hypothetical protein